MNKILKIQHFTDEAFSVDGVDPEDMGDLIDELRACEEYDLIDDFDLRRAAELLDEAFQGDTYTLGPLRKLRAMFSELDGLAHTKA